MTPNELKSEVERLRRELDAVKKERDEWKKKAKDAAFEAMLKGERP